MASRRGGWGALAVSFLLSGTLVSGAPPTCTTHFFDWYELDGQAALDAKQGQWTYQIDWKGLGIAPGEIGRTVHYYQVQCRKIGEAGFDGIHYEWHGNPLKPAFREALEKTGLAVAMFYDMQIRFHGRPHFITPTDAFARQFVDDVRSFYRSVPRALWLHDRNGRLPIVVYGYAFDTRVVDPEPWDRFYRAILAGVEKELAEPVVFHWTNNGSPQQLYGFQHFPQIQSYTFNEAGMQSQVNAHSVTFVAHYDDLGVSAARGGPRARRWIRNDIRYLQEALWLASHTDPDLVFNYGWNELYEGEHLLPDSLWGTWRYELAAALVKRIKGTASKDLPRVLVVADDILPAWQAAEGHQRAVVQRQIHVLSRLRALVPQAEVVLPGGRRDFAQYDVVFSLNARKNKAEEAALAGCRRHVVYFNPDPAAETPMTRRFTQKPRRPLPRREAGPVNEFVVASREVDVDLRRYPRLEYRIRNSPGTVFHIRYAGVNGRGQTVPAWYEASPTDDQSTGGVWREGEADVAEIARRGAGEPIARLRQIDLILDDLEEDGPFRLDVDLLRLRGPAGQTGWEDDFGSVDGWSVHASFEASAGGRSRFSLAAVTEGETTMGQVSLEAVVSRAWPVGADESTRRIEPADDVRVLASTDVQGEAIPLLLARDRAYWVNTYTPSDACWTALFEQMGFQVNRGVSFRSFSHAVTADGLRSEREEGATVIAEEPLPVDRVRLVAPPELDEPLQHTLPEAPGPIRLQVLRGERAEIPFPDPHSDPPAVTLLPGEVVEVVFQR